MKTNSDSYPLYLFRKYGRYFSMCLVMLYAGLQGAFSQGGATPVYTIHVGEKLTGAVEVALPFKNGANIKKFTIETAAQVTMAPNASDTYGMTAETSKKLLGTFPDGIQNGKILFDLTAEDGTSALTEGEYSFTIVMESADQCLSDPLTFKVNVAKKPTLELMDPITVCQGSNGNVVVTAKNFTAGSGATLKYKWTAALKGSLSSQEQGKVGFDAGSDVNVLTYPASNVDQMVVATVSNNNLFPVEIVYTITPIAEYTQQGKTITSIGQPQEVTVTVNPAVDLIVDPAGLTQFICNTGTTDIKLSTANTGAGTHTYEWAIKTGTGTNITGCVAGSGETIAQQLSHSSKGVETVTYVATHTYTYNTVGCKSEVKEVMVTVLPEVDLIADKTAETVCSGSKTNVALSTANEGADSHVYSWKLKGTLPQGVSILAAQGVTENNGVFTGTVLNGASNLAMQLTNTGTSPQEVVFTVTHTYQKSTFSCEKSTDITFTVMPEVDLSVTGEKTLCSAGTTDLTLSTANSGTGCDSKFMWKLNTASYPSDVTLGALPAGVSENDGWYVNSSNKLAMTLTNGGTAPANVEYLVRHEFTKGGVMCYKEEVVTIAVLPTIGIQFSTGDGTALACSETEETINFTTNPNLATDKMGWSWSFDYNASDLSVSGTGITPITPSDAAAYDSAVKGSGNAFKATLTNTPNTTPIYIAVKVTATYDGKCPVNKVLDIAVSPKPVFELGE